MQRLQHIGKDEALDDETKSTARDVDHYGFRGVERMPDIYLEILNVVMYP